MSFRWLISDAKFNIHIWLIDVFRHLRIIVGHINAIFINANQNEGVIRIRPWQIKLFKCVTPHDFYVVIGAHKALIATQHCQDYRNFGFSLNTYNQILKILESNYKWNIETMYNVPLKRGNDIAFTWAFGSTPMSIKGLDDWIVVWNKKEVKGEIDGNIK